MDESEENQGSTDENTNEEEIEAEKSSDTPQSDESKAKTVFPELSKRTKKKLEKKEKKRRKKEKKEGKKEKSKVELENKFRKILHDQFHGILDEDKVFYTIIFFVGAIVVSIFSLFGGSQSWPVTATEIVTMILFLGFLFLMLFAMIPSVKMYMFGSMKEWWQKIIISLIAFGLSALINAALFLNTQPGQTSIIFLEHNTLLPAIFILMFVGWNLIQIHFIKDGLKEVSETVQEKVIPENSDLGKKRTMAIIFLITGQIVPILIHILTIIGFWPEFTTYETPGSPTGQETANLYTFIAWSIIIFVVILITNYWQIRLHRQSNENDTPNVFSNMLYILLWIILWFRSFGFINAFLSSTSSGSDIFLILGNVFLLAFTSIMVLRGLAERVKKTQFISEDAVPFLVYALTIMYVAGQVIMIISGFGTRDQVNMLNNALILVTSLIYYFWYSGYVLQRKGYIPRNILTVEEANKAFNDFGDIIVERHPEDERFIEENVKKLLKKYRIRKIEFELPDLTASVESEQNTSDEASEIANGQVKNPTEADQQKEKYNGDTGEDNINFDDEEEIALAVDEDIAKKTDDEEIEFSDEKTIEKEIDEELQKKSEK